jgi:hypothetical protein
MLLIANITFLFFYVSLLRTSALGLLCDLSWTSQLSPPGVSTRVTTREHPAAEGGTVGEKCPVLLPKCRFTRYIYWSFTCRKTTTWDRRLYFPSEGRRAEEFFTLKIRRLRQGVNPRTWVPKASTLPLDHRSRWEHNLHLSKKFLIFFKIFFSYPRRLNWLWSPPSPLLKGRHDYSFVQSGRSMKLNTNLQLSPRLSMNGAIHLLSSSRSWFRASLFIKLNKN